MKSNANAGSESGLIHLNSPRSVEATLGRIEAVLREAGLAIFCVVDHSGEAERAGLAMRPTKLVLFGNPSAGTPIMVASPSSAIDLPLKALIWQDDGGRVWVSYNSPEYLRARHNLPSELVRNVSSAAALLQMALT
jgi:uncharacterized protein (DUF302 family)